MSSSSPEYKATQRFYRNFGEEPIEVLVKGNLQQLVLSSDIERLVGPRGLPVGQRARAARSRAEGGANGPCGQLARAKTVKVVFGPGHVHQRGGRTRSTNSSPRRPSRPKPQAKQAEARRHAGGARARAARRRSARRSAQQASKITIGALPGGPRDARAAVRPDRAAEPRRPELRLDAGVRLDQAGRHAQAALRLPVPEPRRGAVSVRMKAGLSEAQRDAHDRADPPGGGDAAVAPAARRVATW